MKKFIIEVKNDIVDIVEVESTNYCGDKTMYASRQDAEREADRLYDDVLTTSLPRLKFQSSELYKLAFPILKDGNGDVIIDPYKSVNNTYTGNGNYDKAILTAKRGSAISNKAGHKIPLKPLKSFSMYKFNGSIATLLNLYEAGRCYIVGTTATGGKTTIIKAMHGFTRDEDHKVIHFMANERPTEYSEFELCKGKTIDHLFGNSNGIMERYEMENYFFELHQKTAEYLKQGKHVIWTIDSWNKLVYLYDDEFKDSVITTGGLRSKSRDMCKIFCTDMAGVYKIPDNNGGYVTDSNGNLPSVTVIGTVISGDPRLPLKKDPTYNSFNSVCTGELIPKPECQRSSYYSDLPYTIKNSKGDVEKGYLKDLFKTFGEVSGDTHVSNIREFMSSTDDLVVSVENK